MAARFDLPGLLLGATAISSGIIAVSTASAQQQDDTIRNTYGEVGLLDMPSGHMAQDGDLAFTFGRIRNTERLPSVQILPWMDASFRYSRCQLYGKSGYYDRSFGRKGATAGGRRLSPGFSVGIRDLLGTGLYSSEYLVASKQINSLDFTAGLGWGRLGGDGVLPNPFGYISSSFNTRGQPSLIGQGW